MEHYLPERQYLGHTLMEEVHSETGTTYLEIVEEFDLTTGLYTATYYEAEYGCPPEPIKAEYYTAYELEVILFEDEFELFEVELAGSAS